MACTERGSFSKLCRLLVVIMCLVGTVTGLDTQGKTTKPPTKSNEDSVFKDLLKVIEKHFDKLTTRMAALETTVSSMQFYSIRQFNQISGSLQTTNTDLGTVRKQVNQIEIDGRSQKIALSLLGRDVSDLKKSSSDVLGELESGMVYINENIDKHNDLMRAAIEETMIKNARETTSQMSKHIDRMLLSFGRAQTEPVNCTVDITGVSAHMDLRFVEVKKQANAHVVKLLTAIKMDQKKAAYVREPGQEHNAAREKVDEKLCKCKNGPEKLDIGKEIVTSNYVNDPENITRVEDLISSISGPENITNYLIGRENITNNFIGPDNTTNHIPREDSKEFQDEQDEKVMDALYNMTYSVLQAVSFFRNTGEMLEQILSNTDSLIVEQADLSRRLGIMEVREQVASVHGHNETSNVIPMLHYEERHQALKTMFSDSQSSEGMSDVTMDMLDSVARIIKNGSQLLEVLTDLAQMSSVSLSKVTADLQDEVKGMENLRTHIVTSLLDKAVEDELNPIISLHNTTHNTFKLVEAVASNARWIPLIFQNVQHLESLANRSLQIVTQNQEILIHIQKSVPSQESTQDGDQSDNKPTFSNKPQTLGQMEGLNKDPNVSSKFEVNVPKESLEETYSRRSTNSQTSTLLTTLLPERDHPMRIVSSNGWTNKTEGRLEIYHMGAWQPVCAEGWTTTSASVACQQMGFSSGRPLRVAKLAGGYQTTWLGKITCTGRESKLIACPNDGWRDRCTGLYPAGVRCL